MDRQEIINTYYPAGSELRKILEGHSRQVADMALAIARRLSLEIPPQHIEDAGFQIERMPPLRSELSTLAPSRWILAKRLHVFY